MLDLGRRGDLPAPLAPDPMPRPTRAAYARRLHARRAELSPTELLRHLTEDGDPLALGPLAHAAWAREALLAPPSLLHRRAAERVARELPRMPRETPWAAWLQAHVDRAGEELRVESPLAWRAQRSQPTPFEQSVASCFGVTDADAPRLIRAFHALSREERAAAHTLLPRALFGLLEPPPRPGRPSRRTREAAEEATAVIRRLLATLRTRPR